MKIVELVRNGIQYLRNQEIELRIRMLFFWNMRHCLPL